MSWNRNIPGQRETRKLQRYLRGNTLDTFIEQWIFGFILSNRIDDLRLGKYIIGGWGEALSRVGITGYYTPSLGTRKPLIAHLCQPLIGLLLYDLLQLTMSPKLEKLALTPKDCLRSCSILTFGRCTKMVAKSTALVSYQRPRVLPGTTLIDGTVELVFWCKDNLDTWPFFAPYHHPKNDPFCAVLLSTWWWQAGLIIATKAHHTLDELCISWVMHNRGLRAFCSEQY